MQGFAKEMPLFISLIQIKELPLRFTYGVNSKYLLQCGYSHSGDIQAAFVDLGFLQDVSHVLRNSQINVPV